MSARSFTSSSAVHGRLRLTKLSTNRCRSEHNACSVWDLRFNATPQGRRRSPPMARKKAPTLSRRGLIRDQMSGYIRRLSRSKLVGAGTSRNRLGALELPDLPIRPSRGRPASRRQLLPASATVPASALGVRQPDGLFCRFTLNCLFVI